MAYFTVTNSSIDFRLFALPHTLHGAYKIISSNIGGIFLYILVKTGGRLIFCHARKMKVLKDIIVQKKKPL
jgi:hypothetical protein